MSQTNSRMLHPNYLSIIDDLKKDIFEKFESMPKPNESEYLDYLKIKANLQYFLENTAPIESFEFFKKVWFFQKLAERDQEETSHALNMADIKGTLPSKEQACIYCTFHLGSYRLSNFILVREDIDFTLLISQENLDKSGDTYVKLYEALKREYNKEPSFNILNAEEGKIGLQLIREIKQGKSLMVYLDGNSGVGGQARKDNKLIPINFLDQKILARKGIAYLSHFLNVPIVPILSYRPDGVKTTIEFLPAIIPDKTIDRDQYAQQTTQFLFDTFSKYLLQYPEQWEGWFYVNNFIDATKIKTDQVTTTFNENTSYVFDENRYHLFMKDMLHYLFDVKTYNCIKMPKALWELLRKVEQKEIDYSYLPNLLKKDLFNQLLKVGILIPNPKSI